MLKEVKKSPGKNTVSQRRNKTMLSKKCLPGTKATPIMQQHVLSNFSKSAAYARVACSNPNMKAAYQEIAAPGRSAYHAAIKDALNAPQILDVSRCDNMIVIEAIDDFMVRSVTVSAYDGADELIEQGEAAITDNGMYWKYELTHKQSGIVGVKFVVLAKDHPGNKTEAEIIM